MKQMMDFSQHRYRGFIVRMLGSGLSWRVVVFDPMEISTAPFSYAPQNGVCSKQEAMLHAHTYVDQKVGNEVEQWTHCLKRSDEKADFLRAL